MAQQTLSLETLHMLDNGLAANMVDCKIQEAIFDLDRRGQDGKTRKVIIELSLDKEGEIVETRVRAQAKLPPIASGKTIAKTVVKRGTPTLLFRDDDAENPEQGHFGDEDGSKEAS